MGWRVCCGRPKIWWLIELHRDHPEPLEALLIGQGLRWRDVGTRQFTWGDCLALVAVAPHDSALVRATVPDWRWADPHYELLVMIAEATTNSHVVEHSGRQVSSRDLLHVPRPGEITKTVERFGNNPIPLAELDAWLDGRTA